MKSAAQEQWQISGSGPELYERFAVARHLRPIAERFMQQMPLRAGDRVLDVACGTGIVARLVAAHPLAPAQVTGLDLNEGMVAVARQIATTENQAIDWRQGNAMEMSFASASFDLVVCQQGLQFMPDKLQALREMRRVLVDGGRLALNVFGRASRFHVALADVLARYSDPAVAQLSLTPFAFPDPAALTDLVRCAGFRDVVLDSASISRRVEPTQQWLLEYSSALPYGAAIAAIEPDQRAALLREVAASLRDLWVRSDSAGDSFLVPCEVHFVFARA